MFRFLAALTVAALAAGPALAQRSVVTEVQYYKDIKVEFSENAHVCGFTDPAPFQAQAAKRLSALDIPNNPDAKTSVVIGITASATGLLKQQCIAHMQLQLRAELASEFLDTAAIAGQDNIFVTLTGRKYVFPVIFYQSGALFRDLQPEMQARGAETLDLLLDRLAAARKLK